MQGISTAKFLETEDFQVNETTCRLIDKGTLQLIQQEDVEEIEDTSRLGLCTDIQSLNIELDDRVFLASKLEFIRSLKKLTYLSIMDKSVVMPEVYFPVDETFTYEIPSLEVLKFYGEGIGLNLLQFHACFPNLKKLVIHNQDLSLPFNFIDNLSKLGHLKSLKKYET